MFLEKSRNMGQKTAFSWFRARWEPRAQVQVREPYNFAISRFGHMKTGDSWCRAHPFHCPLAVLTRCRGSRENSPETGDLPCRNGDSGQKTASRPRCSGGRSTAAGRWPESGRQGPGCHGAEPVPSHPKTNVRPLSRPAEPPLPTIPEGHPPSQEFGGFFGSLGSLI